MGSIQEDGFLSEEISAYVKKNRDDNSEILKFCADLNRFAQALMLSLNPPSNDDRRLFIALLFSRVVAPFQATVLLAERGMVSEARMVARGALEATFIVAALCKNPDFLSQYINDDEYQRKRLLGDLIALDDEHVSFLDFDRAELVRLLGDVKARVAENNIKLLKTKDVAELAELLPIYRTLYGLLSRTIHHRVRDLETNVVVDTGNMITEMKWGPKTELGEIKDVLIIACDILFLAVRAMLDFHQKHLDTELSDLRKRYEHLASFGDSHHSS